MEFPDVYEIQEGREGASCGRTTSHRLVSAVKRRPRSGALFVR